MNTDSNPMDWLEPPDHGLNELKGKIARRASRRNAVAGITATAVVVCTTIAVFHDRSKSSVPRAVSDREWQAVVAKHGERLRVINGAALELSDPDADTRVYLVSTLQQEPDPGSG